MLNSVRKSKSVRLFRISQSERVVHDQNEIDTGSLHTRPVMNAKSRLLSTQSIDLFASSLSERPLGPISWIESGLNDPACPFHFGPFSILVLNFGFSILILNKIIIFQHRPGKMSGLARVKIKFSSDRIESEQCTISCDNHGAILILEIQTEQLAGVWTVKNFVRSTLGVFSGASGSI